MTWLRVLVSRVRELFRKGRLEQELNDELRSHLEMVIEENLRKGCLPKRHGTAQFAALAGVEQVKEIYREKKGLPMIETLLQDLRYGMVMRETLTLIIVGVAIGLPAALAAMRLIASMLFGLTPSDPTRMFLRRCF